MRIGKEKKMVEGGSEGKERKYEGWMYEAGKRDV